MSRRLSPLVVGGTALVATAALTGFFVTGIGASQPTPTYGDVKEASRSGAIDLSKVPDYVETTDDTGRMVGYMKRNDMFGSGHEQAIADGRIKVFDRSGVVVGYLYPYGVGFVAKDVADAPGFVPPAGSVEYFVEDPDGTRHVIEPNTTGLVPQR